MPEKKTRRANRESSKLLHTITAFREETPLNGKNTDNSWRGRIQTLPLSAMGWTLIALILICALLIWFWDWQEAWAILGVCAILLVIAILQTLGKMQLSIDVQVEKTRLRRTETLSTTIEVKNSGKMPARATLVELPVGEGVLPLQIPGLAPQATWDKRISFPVEKRGIIQIGPAKAVKQDILQLIRRQHGWEKQERIYVHPNYLYLDEALSGFIRDVEGETTSIISDSDVSFHALRPYLPGDDRRHIHWKMTAHSGKLMMRQYQETRRSHHLVILDLNSSAYAPPDFELAVEIVASLVLSSIRAGQPVTIVSSENSMNNFSAMRALDYLTEVNTLDAETPLVELTTQAFTHNQQASVCSVITGPDVEIKYLSQIALRCPSGIMFNGFRADEGATWGRKLAGEQQILTIGKLEHLRRSLAQRSVR